MKRVLGALILGLLAVPAWAVDYYIAPSGDDTKDGLFASTAWKTWSKVQTSAPCGSRVFVLDGTYTVSANGSPSLIKACTAGSTFTVVAVNERVPLIQGTGATESFKVTSSAYVIIEGLRIKGADLPGTSGGTNASVVSLRSCNNCTFRRNIVSHNNRYFNTHLIEVRSTASGTHETNTVLLEDNEYYNFHRHAIFAFYSNGNTYRREYCNSRDWPDIAGGFPSGVSTVGDDCIALYPSNNNIVENVMAESVLSVIDSEATSTDNNNKFYGIVGYGTRTASNSFLYGGKFRNRGATLGTQIRDFFVKDAVFVNPGHPSSGGGLGLYPRGALNFQIENVSVFNPLNKGILADVEPGNGGSGTYSFFCTNCLVVDGDSTGIQVDGTITTWTVTNSNAYNNVTNYSPSSSSNYVPNPPASVNPGMGSCYLWPPDGSAAATNGWGGRILYQYSGGTLTTIPLWDKTTGEWAAKRAVIAGVNSDTAVSLNGIHTRLHVNNNGCSFPASYTGSAPPPPSTSDITQTRFRFEEFNGPEDTPNLKAGENVSYTTQIGGCARIRMKLAGSASVVDDLYGFVLWASYNGGAYAAVGDVYSNKIKFAGAGLDTIGNVAVTEQMTSDGSATTTSGVLARTSATMPLVIHSSSDVELIVLLCIDSTAVPAVDHWDLRLRRVDPTTLAVSDITYAVGATPRITAKSRRAGAM